MNMRTLLILCTLLSSSLVFAKEQNSIIQRLKTTIEEENISVAIDEYRLQRSKKVSDYEFHDGQLNNLGYFLLGEEKITDAIKIFILNTEYYPDKANVYDSLGEAYYIQEDYEKSLSQYQQALKLLRENETHGWRRRYAVKSIASNYEKARESARSV